MLIFSLCALGGDVFETQFRIWGLIIKLKKHGNHKVTRRNIVEFNLRFGMLPSQKPQRSA